MRTKWSTLCYHDDFVSNLNIFNIDVWFDCFFFLLLSL
jgi:hypothetical protein